MRNRETLAKPGDSISQFVNVYFIDIVCVTRLKICFYGYRKDDTRLSPIDLLGRIIDRGDQLRSLAATEFNFPLNVAVRLLFLILLKF